MCARRLHVALGVCLDAVMMLSNGICIDARGVYQCAQGLIVIGRDEVSEMLGKQVAIEHCQFPVLCVSTVEKTINLLLLSVFCFLSFPLFRLVLSDCLLSFLSCPLPQQYTDKYEVGSRKGSPKPQKYSTAQKQKKKTQLPLLLQLGPSPKIQVFAYFLSQDLN